MRDINRIDLQFEKTIDYFKDNINGGNFLSEEVLRLIDFSKGTFFTVLPQEADLSHLYNFDAGGIMPLNPLNEELLVRLKNTTDDEVANYLTMQINKNENLACLFEDVTKDPKHNLKKYNQMNVLHFYDNCVYYIINSSNLSFESMKTCIVATDAIWHCLFVLAKDLYKTYPEILTKEMISSFCAHAKLIICGAYDGEGYIFWEPKSV